MLIGYMRVSTEGDRQSTDLQRDALITAGIDERNIFENKALEYVKEGDVLVVWSIGSV
jgi:DNA invertase Pin-like site-specific DNA recombinase